MLTPSSGPFPVEVTVSLKWGSCGHFGGGTDTVSSVIDVTLPHTPLPMAGKGYSRLRCFLLRGWCPTGTVGGILGVYGGWSGGARPTWRCLPEEGFCLLRSLLGKCSTLWVDCQTVREI